MATNARAEWKPEQQSSTVSVYMVSGAAHKAIDFMTNVFNAQVVCKMMSDDNTSVRHASLRIDDTTVMISDGCKDYPPFPVWMHIYVEDVDKTYELALSKGAESVHGPRDEFYGDRVSTVKDPAGNTWWIATHKFTPKCLPSGNKECKVDATV
ncbi:uncharacterized protein [Physcomitrium patens]|uniref:VOC domain-containing protein n=1 Tax=Physcomitrium patens TaxID=3218 RepID=A9T8D9_PHYPA|nr:uncharacterized protein LOC112276492 [Physcomitrium patens]|eukprot:XP_024363646.1 uncharacterized protein LOC112276492 [Physcomitrella patens]